MQNYNIEFSYLIREYGAVVLPAEDAEKAEFSAMEYIRETYPDVEGVELETLEALPERAIL